MPLCGIPPMIDHTLPVQNHFAKVVVRAIIPIGSHLKMFSSTIINVYLLGCFLPMLQRGLPSRMRVSPTPWVPYFRAPEHPSSPRALEDLGSWTPSNPSSEKLSLRTLDLLSSPWLLRVLDHMTPTRAPQRGFFSFIILILYVQLLF